MTRDPALASAYKGCPSTLAKAAFRKHWAQTKLNDVIAGKKKEKRTVQSFVDQGTYLPFEMVWHKEGRSDLAWQAALKYCNKCLALGGEWTQLNVMTERLEFLYIRKCVNSSIETIWSMWQQEHGEQLQERWILLK